MWHWWYRTRADDVPGVETLGEGPETTVTWAHLLREAKDPGDQVEDAQVDSNRWMSAGRPMTRQY